MKKTASRKKVTRAKKPTHSDKRRSIRFKPDLGDVAMLEFKNKANPLPALILNESFTGACLACICNESLKPGMMVKAKVGKLSFLPAEVVWVEDIDSEVLKFGIEYTDEI
jgi:hypothetical protein